MLRIANNCRVVQFDKCLMPIFSSLFLPKLRVPLVFLAVPESVSC